MSSTKTLAPQSGRDAGSVGADDAASEDHDVGRRDAGDAREQDAASALGTFQVLGPLLQRHAPRHLAHRHEQGKLAVLQLNGLVGQRNDA